VCPSPDTQSVYPNWRPKCNPDPTALTSLADREPLDENRHRTCAFAVLWPFKAAGFWRRARFPSGARDKPYPSKSARINSRFRHTGIWLICIAGERFLKPPCRPSMPSGRLIPVIIPSKRERLARERFAQDCVAHHLSLALVPRLDCVCNQYAKSGVVFLVYDDSIAGRRRLLLDVGARRLIPNDSYIPASVKGAETGYASHTIPRLVSALL
jgi:hypothetical protein